jgi:hypothetical protein
MLAALPADHAARAVVETIDFFSLDALHDLIFNAVEHRFTPRDLGPLLAGAGLAFAGFEISRPLPDAPRGHEALDLERWDDYERSHPETFSEMFQFWCRKPTT